MRSPSNSRHSPAGPALAALTTTVALLACGSLAGPARAAGTVDVSFVEPARFVDAGRGETDLKRTVGALEAAFLALAPRLPDGQQLSVRVTQVDLAGELKPARAGAEIRVLSGRADWPRMELSYTLVQAGRTLKSGTARLADMAYLQQPLGARQGEPYAYEQRMIERWFTDTIVPTRRSP